jgi:valyl-tRNA synthetase
MKEPASKALEAVLNGNVRIHPEERFLATYKYWLENVKDWCISRQLWWGQRIPAWYAPDGSFIVAETKEEAFDKLKSERSKVNSQSKTNETIHHSPLNIDQISQDEDVLDTWFSSWLWPIEVFKGITEPGNKEINYYYPTSVLVTGQDIIFFWVARMIMAGMEYMNEKPFSDVYFTGMVRDKQGRKMSKSLGNSPDLLELIDRFGADAVRFGIMISSPAGNDLLFDDSSCDQGRNFNNKIWNALKLVKMWEARQAVIDEIHDSRLTSHGFAISWFENRLNEVKTDVEKLYKDFRLSEALKNIYSLIWDDFCSWYLEWVKPGFEQPIEKEVYEKTVWFFEELIQLLHPFMPFVTEEIYHQLEERKEGDDLTIKQQATIGNLHPEILKQGVLVKEVITTIRDARIKNQLKQKDPVKLYIDTSTLESFKTVESIIARQVNAESISYVSEAIQPSIAVVIQKDKFYIQTDIAIDKSSQKEQLQKDLEYQKGFLASVEKKLSNERFVLNAKQEIVESEKKKKADAEEKINILEQSIKKL